VSKVFPLLLLITFLVAGCNKKDNTGKDITEIINDEQEYANYPWPALARLCAGENPIWFEFGHDGPFLIETAAAASLAPYVPWPHARYATAMAIWNGFLVMAVNRDGFLVFGPAGESAQPEAAELLLYRSSSGGLWDPYTTESFFIWEGKPAVLLYRNDFFGELTAPTPDPSVYTLDFFSPVPVGTYVPALGIFPSDGTWETELLRRGPEGRWYYRMKEKAQGRHTTAYFSTTDLNVEGKKISFGEWMNSDRGETPENIPHNLAILLERVLEFLPGTKGQLKAVSPDFEGQRVFAIGSTAGTSDGISAIVENNALLYAYCQDAPEPLALIILPGGTGFTLTGDKREAVPFSLPIMPGGFVYTGVAVLGNVLIASWEEQREAGVGAAGFMVMAFSYLQKEID
jgi:hypothetical protein